MTWNLIGQIAVLTVLILLVSITVMGIATAMLDRKDRKDGSKENSAGVDGRGTSGDGSPR